MGSFFRWTPKKSRVGRAERKRPNQAAGRDLRFPTAGSGPPNVRLFWPAHQKSPRVTSFPALLPATQLLEAPLQSQLVSTRRSRSELRGPNTQRLFLGPRQKSPLRPPLPSPRVYPQGSFCAVGPPNHPRQEIFCARPKKVQTDLRDSGAGCHNRTSSLRVRSGVRN